MSNPTSETSLERDLNLLSPQIFRFACYLCGKREDAEEMSQETMMRVGANLGQLRDRARLKPWAFQIAQNVHRMRQRTWAMRPVRYVSLEAVLDGPQCSVRREIADGALLPDESAFWSEMRRAVLNAISELPLIYRAVVVLRDLNGLSTTEAAEFLSVSEEVIKTRLHRARLELRERLRPFRPRSPRASGRTRL